MGSYEDRQTYQESTQTKGRLKSLVSAGKGLPKAFKLYFACQLEDDEPWRRHQRIDALARDCEASWQSLSAKKRRAVLKTLLPELADVAEAALDVVARSTYQTGYMRRPFRCPQSATQIAACRHGGF